MITNNEKPCLVQAGQGLNILNTVQYKSKFLYSKYNPKGAIERIIEGLNIDSETLIVICSPCLWYGIEELQQKAPVNTIVAIEEDENLYQLAKESNSSIPLYCTSIKADLFALDDFLQKRVLTGDIKRVLRVDFSQGVQFYEERYNQLLKSITQIVSVFWKNRITLLKMGKLFSKNVLSNIKRLSSEHFISDFEKTVTKPILVVGAGESIDIFSDWENVKKGRYFVIAVDASLTCLKARGIKPDAVVALESQFAITKAYLDFKDSKILMFADICSRPQIPLITKGNVVWYASNYYPCDFTNSLLEKKIIPYYFVSMGSVGLVAVKIASTLRKTASTPIICTGLDFSWTLGKTHAKSAPHHLQRLIDTNRFNPVENIGASFAPGTLTSVSMNKNVYFSQNMLSYAIQMEQMFANQNIYLDQDFGINKNFEIYEINENDFVNPNVQQNNEEFNCVLLEEKFDEERRKLILEYCNSQIEDLEELLDLLQKGEKSRFCNEDLHGLIQQKLKDKNYLYLHFPDGYKLSMEQQFLNRIRAEVPFFLKVLKR